MPSVDEKLLAQNESSADRAGSLREAKQGSKNQEEDDVSFKDTMNFIKNPAVYVDDDVEKANRRMLRASLFNQRIQAAKRKKGEDINKKKGGLAGKISQAQIATAQLLRTSWVSLIKSFGLTLIYINIHWLLNQVFPTFFCKLGEEWFLRPGVKGNPTKEKIVKEAGKKINLVETMGCGCLNLVVFLAIISALIISLWPIAVTLKIIELGKRILEIFGLI